MRFYFDFDNYFTLLRLGFSESSTRARLYTLAVLGVGVPVTALFHAVCFALDPILWPALRRTEVREPVFIIGHARSGTTLTFRLISQDVERFSFFQLWECYFPSLIQKRAIRAIARADARFLNGWIGGWAGRFEDWRYGPARHMHKMGLRLPEEDDISLFYSMASGFWMTKIPAMGVLDFFYVDRWPEKKRRRLNAFYRELVRRQICLNGGGQQHLSKNPYWTGRIESLIDAFPDARFVVNVRDPRATIPSLLKLNRSAWKGLGWDEAKQKESLEVLLSQSAHHYRHPLEVLESHPATPRAILEYDDLLGDPASAIEGVYRDLDLPVTAAFRERLAAESPGEKKHATTYSYSLEEFGIEPDFIRNEFGDLFERFGWNIEADEPPTKQETLVP
jgi:hypothetical protein